MKADFTLETYRELLRALSKQGFCFQTVDAFMTEPLGKVVILRHDVDRLPKNALLMARLENELEFAATYYFRAVAASWDERVIRKINLLGHEIGYHYESLSSCHGNFEKAIEDFKVNLSRLRNLVPVSTVCMHGSPLSGIKNLDLLKSYNYKGLAIVAEPYFDIDFNQVFYITDTGRKWNSTSASIRDKVDSSFNIPVKSTSDIIEIAAKGGLPDKVMISTHPHRWFDFGLGWVKELVEQNIKNIGKAALIKMRKT